MTRLLLLASLSLAACMDETSPDESSVENPSPPPGDPEDEAARAAFEAVYPTLAAKCSAAACHGASGDGASPIRFVATTADETYELLQDPALRDVLIGPKLRSSHYGIVYTAPELAAIETWLAAEAARD